MIFPFLKNAVCDTNSLKVGVSDIKSNCGEISFQNRVENVGKTTGVYIILQALGLP